jgi:flagellar capping protein FliD
VATHDDRFSTLEKTVTLLQRQSGSSIQELNRNTTMLLGVVSSQQLDIKEIKISQIITEERLGSIDQRITGLEEKMDQRFAQVDQRITGLEEKMDQRFAQVDQRITGLEEKMDQRFEQVDQRFEKMDQRFEKMDQRFEVFQGALNQVLQMVTLISTKMV